MGEKYEPTGAEVAMVLVLAVPVTVFEGWLLSWMWLWFVVPLGLAPISAIHGAALRVVAVWFQRPNSFEADESPVLIFAKHTAILTVLTGIGWAFHAWI